MFDPHAESFDYVAENGMHIVMAADRAIQLATKHERRCVLVFRDQRIVVHDSDNAYGIRDAYHNRTDCVRDEPTPKPATLTYEDALRIAKGCFDYSGGHGSDRNRLDIFHHGIQTVINALEGAQKSGLSDLQSQVLHHLGKQESQ